MTVHIAYKTDKHHSHASKEIIGIGTTEKAAIKICMLQSQRERYPLITQPEILKLLEQKHQTQQYKGEGEFLILSFKTNFLL